MADARAEPRANGGLPRAFDAIAAATALVVLSPVLLAVAITVALSSRGPLLFRQQRVGRSGRQFTIVKFRTMIVNSGRAGVTVASDARITPLGAWLRRFKLDELPELWNVVRGDMALVGPRPELPRYVDMRNPLWRQVLEYRPGITDPVTLMLLDEEGILKEERGDREAFYRNSLQPWKLRGSRDYLARRTWRSDVAVLYRTVMAVATRGKHRVSDYERRETRRDRNSTA